MPALLIRLRPTGPWRIGPDSGDRDRVDRIYHSDSVYSAVSSAMARLGELDSWLDASARSEKPEVRFSSCFPFHGETLYVVPPRHLWPPPASAKVRFKGAKFVPVKAVETLASGKSLGEENWSIDGASECLISSGAHGPFRVSVRSNAAVDRLGQNVAAHSTACLEFTPGSGLWMIAEFADESARDRWKEPVTAALRLLADSGFGGERSLGWGRSEMPEIIEGELPSLLWKSSDDSASGETAFWMLSLFHPAPSDPIDWERGNYSLTMRGGRVDRSGDEKRVTRMLTEGSVIVSAEAPQGSASDVAPENFPHPVYRAGFAVAIPVPLTITRQQQ